MDTSLDDVGLHMDVAIEPVTGTLYISYYREDTGDLWMARHVGSGGNCGTGNAWSCQLVDSVGDVGQYNSIAVRHRPDGTGVSIAYHDSTNRSLKEADALCTDTCSFEVGTIEAGNPTLFVSVGLNTSITYDRDGLRHIAYRKSTLGGSSVKFAVSALAGSGDCGVGNYAWDFTCKVVAEGSGFGQFTSIDTDETWMYSNPGRCPSIGFYDGTLKRAMVARWDANSATWILRSAHMGSVGSIDTGRSVALYVEDTGLPHLAFRNDADGELIYATYVGTGGNCGVLGGTTFPWQCDVIDDEIGSITTGGYLSGSRTVDMAQDADGRPIIVYRDASEDLAPPILKVARPIAAMPPGTTPNCGPEILFLTWYCEVVDTSPNQYIEFGDSVAIDSVGVGDSAIVYSKGDDYYLEDGLMVGSHQSLIFVDDFELGSTSRWDVSIP